MRIRLFKHKRLKFAIVKNDLKTVSKLLTEGISPNILIDGKTPLMYSLEKGYFDIALTLIEANADVLKTDADGYSSLHYAFINENTPFKVIKSLVLHGANVNAKTSIGRTPLHMACINGNLPAMKYLLSRGANLYTTDMFGNTLMHMACSNNYTDIAKFLIQNELNLYERNNRGVVAVNLLENSKKQDLLDTIRFESRRPALLLRKESLGVRKNPLQIPMRPQMLHINEYDFTPNNYSNSISNLLFVACKKGNVKYAEYLIDMGANVMSTDMLGNNLLMNVACKNNDVGMIKLLMKHGVDIYAKNYLSQRPADLLSSKTLQKLHLGYVDSPIIEHTNTSNIKYSKSTASLDTLLKAKKQMEKDKPPFSARDF